MQGEGKGGKYGQESMYKLSYGLFVRNLNGEEA